MCNGSISIVCFLQKVDSVILNPLILLLFALAFVYFLYGIVKFLNPNTGEKDKTEARGAILWGIVGMAIMFSVYGLIAFILTTFGVTSVPCAAQPFVQGQADQGDLQPCKDIGK